MQTRLTRRHFLQAGATAALAPLVLRGDDKKPAPSERLNVALIGVEGQGQFSLGGIIGAGCNLVALCDVDERRVGKSREKHPKAFFTPDYRKVLDMKGLDAVAIATPDHNHAVITMAALKSGRHVYCEKPLTHTVFEARAVAKEAKKRKLVTQMGTQIHAGNNYRRVVELIQSGAIGNVKEVHTFCGKSWDGPKDRPTGTPPVPKGLHYDLWVGPAPFRPYNPAYLPAEWRRYWDFGGGTLADMACHHMDLPFWALKLRHPTKVSAKGSPVYKEGTARWTVVTYEYGPRGDMPATTLTWYDGGKRPAIMSQPGMPRWGDGSLFVGDKGMMLADYGRYVLLPQKEFKGFKPPKQTIPNSIGHHKEWVEACKHGGTTTCNFDYSGALTEAVLLGTVAYRAETPFTWDSENFKTSEPKANDLLQQEYRKGWSL
jgi:predicted dehydrogenase